MQYQNGEFFGGKSVYAHIPGSLNRAWAHTKTVLFSPFDLKKWVVLSFIVFIAQFVSGNSFNFNPGGGGGGGSSSGSSPSDVSLPDFSALAAYIGVALVLIAVFLILWLVMMYFGSVFKFILMESVSRNEVAIGPYWSESKKRGGGYFRWNLALTVVALLLLGLPALLLGLAFLQSGDASSMLGVGGLCLYLPWLFLVLIVLGAVNLVVAGLAVPAMVGMDSSASIWAAASYMLKALWAKKSNFFVFVVAMFLLEMVVNTAAFVLAMLPAMLLGVILLVPLIGLLIAFSSNAVLVILFALLMVLAVFVLMYVVMFFMVPVIVFKTSFSLFFAGSLFPEYNVMPGNLPPSPAQPGAFRGENVSAASASSGGYPVSEEYVYDDFRPSVEDDFPEDESGGGGIDLNKDGR